MIDCIGFKVEGYTMQEFHDSLAFIDLTMPPESERMIVNWQNLRLTYYPNQRKLVLMNSLHKFYMAELGDVRQPINWNDFTLWNMEVIKNYLTEVFQVDAKNFEIHSILEFGLNVETIIKPFDIINRYQSYSGTNDFFTVSPRKGKPIQRESCLTDWKIKTYDKGQQAQLSFKNILRYEIVVQQLRKMRQVLKMESITLEDMAKLETWNLLFIELMRIYECIKKVPWLGSEVDIDTIHKIYAYANAAHASDIKNTLSVDQNKKLRAKFKTNYELFDKNELNIHEQVKLKMVEKYQQLITTY